MSLFAFLASLAVIAAVLFSAVAQDETNADVKRMLNRAITLMLLCALILSTVAFVLTLTNG